MGPIKEPSAEHFYKQMDETRSYLRGADASLSKDDGSISISVAPPEALTQPISDPFRVIDIPYSKVEHKEMNGLTREELDAKLDARDAKADARMVRFEERMNLAIQQMGKDSERFGQSVRDIDTKISSMKWWMIGTGLSVVIGIASFNATMLSNMVSTFDSGRDTGAAIEKATSKLDSLADDIRKDYQNTQNKIDELEKKIPKNSP